jgi:hypothetical protein
MAAHARCKPPIGDGTPNGDHNCAGYHLATWCVFCVLLMGHGVTGVHNGNTFCNIDVGSRFLSASQNCYLGGTLGKGPKSAPYMMHIPMLLCDGRRADLKLERTTLLAWASVYPGYLAQIAYVLCHYAPTRAHFTPKTPVVDSLC